MSTEVVDNFQKLTSKVVFKNIVLSLTNACHFQVFVNFHYNFSIPITLYVVVVGKIKLNKFYETLVVCIDTCTSSWPRSSVCIHTQLATSITNRCQEGRNQALFFAYYPHLNLSITTPLSPSK